MEKQEFFNNYHHILKECNKPSRYIGGEFLSANKDFSSAKVTMALAFPDKYEIGISNFGHKILYSLINNVDYFMADRIYAPEPDFLEKLIEKNALLYALESKEPLNKFDFVGFALQYELSYTTLLKMLEVSKIPVLNEDRKDGDPIILSGGPCAYNPLPLSKFVDLFLIGDGEDSTLEIMEKYLELKNSGKKREEIVEELAKIEGVYSYKYSKSVKKRISQLKLETAPTKSPIPHFESVHDRVTVEIRRGCSRLCRFCQSAHTNLPIRERPKEDVEALVKEYVKNTGYGEYSLLSLSSNDHTQIEDIIFDLNDYFKGSGVSVSLPSQRADKFSLRLANLMQEVRKSAVTIAPEAGTQRLRDIIKKNLTTEQIISATLACIKSGWQKIKYYLMIGLPFETYEDIEGIAELFENVNNEVKKLGIKLPQITCSISIFVPKPFTPFGFAPQNSLEEIYKKITFLKEKAAKYRNVRLNFHTPRLSQVEAFLTRGDERVADFVYELYKEGSYLDSWDENFSYDKYVEVASKLGLNIEDEATRTYSIDKPLPWDFIEINYDKKYFIDQYEEARTRAELN